MKFNTIARIGMAAGLSVALGLGTVACSRDYTAAYVYSVSNVTGQIAAFGVDYQSGILTQISGSPFPSNLTNPITILSAPNGKTLYEIGGSQNAQVESLTIGSDGKLYEQKTPNITGTFPTAAAIDTTGTYLFVTYRYQTGFGPSTPGAGGVTIFPISQTDGSLGTPLNVNVGFNPVAIAVSAPMPNVFVYVVDQEVAPNLPTILGFSQNTTNGALTPLSGTTFNGTTYAGTTVGVSPSSIAIDPTSRYLYVTDKLQNVMYGFQIARENTGNLTPLVSSPFATGQYPLSVTIEPRGKYVYVANYNSNTVSSYSLNLANGSLGGSATTGSGFATSTGPTCVTVEPALGVYLYTSNYLDGSISGGQINTGTGQLTAVTNSFFPTGTQPACLTAVANGPHSSQLTLQ